MSITNERMVILTEFLNDNEERARELLSIEASAAVEKINAHGHTFTKDELHAYGKLLNHNLQQLEDGTLEGVAGGTNTDMDDFMSTERLVVGFPAAVVAAYAVAVGPLVIPW